MCADQFQCKQVHQNGIVFLFERQSEFISQVSWLVCVGFTLTILVKLRNLITWHMRLTFLIIISSRHSSDQLPSFDQVENCMEKMMSSVQVLKVIVSLVNKSADELLYWIKLGHFGRQIKILTAVLARIRFV